MWVNGRTNVGRGKIKREKFVSANLEFGASRPFTECPLRIPSSGLFSSVELSWKGKEWKEEKSSFAPIPINNSESPSRARGESARDETANGVKIKDFLERLRVNASRLKCKSNWWKKMKLWPLEEWSPAVSVSKVCRKCETTPANLRITERHQRLLMRCHLEAEKSRSLLINQTNARTQNSSIVKLFYV